jgi:hypothetical protein
MIHAPSNRYSHGFYKDPIGLTLIISPALNEKLEKHTLGRLRNERQDVTQSHNDAHADDKRLCEVRFS